jgi:hypothetical protein
MLVLRLRKLIDLLQIYGKNVESTTSITADIKVDSGVTQSHEKQLQNKVV